MFILDFTITGLGFSLDIALRFDLIYLILDKADEQTDRRLAKHIVALHFENPEVWSCAIFSFQKFRIHLLKFP